MPSKRGFMGYTNIDFLRILRPYKAIQSGFLGNTYEDLLMDSKAFQKWIFKGLSMEISEDLKVIQI